MEPLKAIQYTATKDQSRYITPEISAEVFPRDLQGAIPVAIRELTGAGELWLVDRVYGKLIVPGNPKLATLGCHVINVRGWHHYEDAHEDLNVVPGESLRLTREPENRHDSNAIAINVYGDDRVLGYVNKGLARRLARRIDSGLELECMVLRSPGGSNIFTVVICSADLLEQAMK